MSSDHLRKVMAHSPLPRWLLMCEDRLTSKHIPLTHEFLSIMLGVQRSGVTIAMGELEHQ
jgi:hypothetical protein